MTSSTRRFFARPSLLPPRTALLIALGAEVLYIGGRTLIGAGVQEMVFLELATTAWRVLFVALYLWLFLEKARAAWRASARRALHPLLKAGIATLIIVVLMAGYWQNRDMATLMVFTLTTPVVALREELFYRFILQDAFERNMQPIAAIFLSSILFVLSHLGTLPMNVPAVISLMSAGVLLGVVYQRTRSLRLVVLLHLAINLAFLLSLNIISPLTVLLGYAVVFFLALGGWSLDDSRERRGA